MLWTALTSLFIRLQTDQQQWMHGESGSPSNDEMFREFSRKNRLENGFLAVRNEQNIYHLQEVLRRLCASKRATCRLTRTTYIDNC